MLLCTVDEDYSIGSSLTEQSFLAPDADPVCIELEAAVDFFVEDDEILTVRVESTDRAVTASDEDTPIRVTIIDISPGNILAVTVLPLDFVNVSIKNMLTVLQWLS